MGLLPLAYTFQGILPLSLYSLILSEIHTCLPRTSPTFGNATHIQAPHTPTTPIPHPPSPLASGRWACAGVLTARESIPGGSS